jgi:hypothetical protein
LNTAVLVLYSGGIDKDHLQSMNGLSGKVGVVSLHDNPLVDHARSYLASYVLQHSPDANVLVWVDDDIVFNPNDLLELAELCRSGHPLIGGVYSSRQPGGIVIGGGMPGESYTYYSDGDIQPVPMVGMGFTAIHRSVYEAIGGTLPEVSISTMGGFKGKPYFSCMIENGVYYGEDTSFCLRAKACGFITEVDTRFRLLHKGEYFYKLEDTGARVEQVNSLTMTFAKK